MTGAIESSSVDWRDRARTAVCDGLSLIQAGTGKPLLLVHGVGLRAEAWAAQMDHLSLQYNVFAVDLPGHGESDGLTGQSGLQDFSRRIEGVIDYIGEPVILIGHSLGAMIALDLGTRHPHLCRGIAALNAVYQRSDAATTAVRARAAALDGLTAADPEGTLSRWFGNSLCSPEAEACRRWLTTVNPAGYKTAYTAFAREDGPDTGALAGFRHPALFVTGTGDPNSTAAMSREMAGTAPAGLCQVIDGAAHMMPMTHPARVNHALSTFCDLCYEEKS